MAKGVPTAFAATQPFGCRRLLLFSTQAPLSAISCASRQTLKNPTTNSYRMHNSQWDGIGFLLQRSIFRNARGLAHLSKATIAKCRVVMLYVNT